MDKTILKNFAVYSRKKLREEITNKAAMIGITKHGIEKPLPESTTDMLVFDIKAVETYKLYNNQVKQYENLIKELNKRKDNQDYETAYSTLIEEVAYTWFNRLIAIRFMEVNNYLPDKIRVLSSGREGVNEPELVTNYQDTNLKFKDGELKQLADWKLDGSAIAMERMFHLLFIKQCNTLNQNLPELFEQTDDYAELLLSFSYNDPNGVLYKLVHEIPEEYFNVESENGQVEIIGWMYQYYNSERKDEVFSRPKSIKIQKEDIPAATQLFTPDWIVRYMVENSLGRLWIEKLIAAGDTRSEKEIAEGFKWMYYISEAEQNPEIMEKLIDERMVKKDIQLESIRFIDPAMGSFHIGVYAFEVFMQLYESQGYSAREAAILIIENNLYGIDIDERAYQLSYFACMMKGRQYNRGILNGQITSNLYSICESNEINRRHLDYLGNDIKDQKVWDKTKKELIEILDLFKDAKEYGSILRIPDDYDFESLKYFILSSKINAQVSFETSGLENTKKRLVEILEVAKVLSQQFDIVVTNPPYMGSSGMSSKLSKYVKDYYAQSKSDLFAVFMERCNCFTKYKGFYAMITQHSWMFLSSYEKLRIDIQDNTIVNMLHLGTRAFEEIGGEVVQTTSFVLKKSKTDSYKGVFIRLVDFNNAHKKEIKVLESIRDPECKYYYESVQDSFNKIPGGPIAYWASDNLIKAFETGKPMNSIIDPRQGLATAHNDRFLKLWHEVNNDKISFTSESIEISMDSGRKWFPYNKGGARRQWYGNYDYVVNWESDGSEIRNFKDARGKLRSRPQNTSFYFRESITWPLITSGGFSIRYRERGSIHDVAGMSAFATDHERLMYILGLMSTKIADYIFKMLNPTINLQIGDFNNFPVLFSDNKMILEMVEENISIAKKEWNSYEEAWEFKRHSFLSNRSLSLKNNYEIWEEECSERIKTMKSNEEELNRIFIKLYKLEEDISPEVDIKDITLRDADLTQDIKSFISYAVGCMMGRYSLDIEGLAYAGGNWDDSSYSTFIPTKNNMILITDAEYFKDDITNRFIDFIEVTYGKENLEKNLVFIAEALGGEGTSIKVIRDYFLKYFYEDHCKRYSVTGSGRRPIYWLYDSGKQDGFKALIYMHRYNQDTTGKLRINYLHKMQKEYERIIDNLRYDIAHNKNAKEVAASEKRLTKITKQLKECKDYDEKIAHIALARIPIDLDDGVKVNYDKIQTDENGKNLQILAKI